MTAYQMKEMAQEYRRLRAVVPLGTLRTKKDYVRATEMLDAILDEIGEDEKHPLAEHRRCAGCLCGEIRSRACPDSRARPAAVLKFLMKQHGLRQTDLPEIGSQGVVSEVLAGRRKLNTRQIKRLARRFGVSAAVFV